MVDTVVVIPHWNGYHLLDRCLRALRAQRYRDFRVVVVDNGSTDGSPDHVERTYPEICLIRSESNRGFAAAVNLGISAIDSRFVAVLNNDTEASPEWLSALVSVAESVPDVGMLASTMLLADRDGIIDGVGICVDRAGFAWDCRGGEPDLHGDVSPFEVFGPSGGAALYRRAMLDEVGLFDEDFFAYLEDVDLAWRARKLGWRCLSVPDARVLHWHSATAVEGSPFKSYHLGRNKVWLLAKNYPLRALWGFVPMVLLYDAFAVGYALTSRRDVHALRGRLAGWRGIHRIWAKRSAQNSAPDKSTRYLSSPRWPWQIRSQLAHIHRPSA